MDHDEYGELFRKSYYDVTDMQRLSPDIPLQHHTKQGTRFCLYQTFGYTKKSEGYMVTGNISIPKYCQYCAGDGDIFWNEPQYIVDNCVMSEPRFSAVRNGDDDTIGWSSKCPECGAEAIQIIDTPHPYQYQPPETE